MTSPRASRYRGTRVYSHPSHTYVQEGRAVCLLTSLYLLHRRQSSPRPPWPGSAWPVPVPACAVWAPSSSRLSKFGSATHVFVLCRFLRPFFVARAPQPAVGDHSTAHQILEGGRAPPHLHWPNAVKHTVSTQHSTLRTPHTAIYSLTTCSLSALLQFL